MSVIGVVVFIACFFSKHVESSALQTAHKNLERTEPDAVEIPIQLDLQPKISIPFPSPQPQTKPLVAGGSGSFSKDGKNNKKKKAPQELLQLLITIGLVMRSDNPGSVSVPEIATEMSTAPEASKTNDAVVSVAMNDPSRTTVFPAAQQPSDNKRGSVADFAETAAIHPCNSLKVPPVCAESLARDVTQSNVNEVAHGRPETTTDTAVTTPPTTAPRIVNSGYENAGNVPSNDSITTAQILEAIAAEFRRKLEKVHDSPASEAQQPSDTRKSGSTNARNLPPDCLSKDDENSSWRKEAGSDDDDEKTEGRITMALRSHKCVRTCEKAGVSLQPAPPIPVTRQRIVPVFNYPPAAAYKPLNGYSRFPSPAPADQGYGNDAFGMPRSMDYTPGTQLINLYGLVSGYPSTAGSTYFADMGLGYLGSTGYGVAPGLGRKKREQPDPGHQVSCEGSWVSVGHRKDVSYRCHQICKQGQTLDVGSKGTAEEGRITAELNGDRCVFSCEKALPNGPGELALHASGNALMVQAGYHHRRCMA